MFKNINKDRHHKSICSNQQKTFILCPPNSSQTPPTPILANITTTSIGAFVGDPLTVPQSNTPTLPTWTSLQVPVTFPTTGSGSNGTLLTILNSNTYSVPVIGPVNLYTPGEIFAAGPPFIFASVTISVIYTPTNGGPPITLTTATSSNIPSNKILLPPSTVIPVIGPGIIQVFTTNPIIQPTVNLNGQLPIVVSKTVSTIVGVN
jgi:hypothetical protein